MIVYLNINETTQKKQLNFSTTAIKILSQSFLKSNPPPLAVLIPNYKTEVQKVYWNLQKPAQYCKHKKKRFTKLVEF